MKKRIISLLLVLVLCCAMAMPAGAAEHSMTGTNGRISPDPNHVHQYSADVTAPTCTEQGYTTYTCECGDRYESDYVDPLGHDWGEWVSLRVPTCTRSGLEYRTCFRCNETEYHTIDATGHIYEAVVTDPTCTEQGFTTYTCKCGASYVSDYTDLLDHDYEKGICIYCGTEDPDWEENYDHPMTDISGHWAEEDIAWVLMRGLFNGISETEFNPDGSMTRGMFVTVLGRYAGVDPAEYNDWYLPNLYTDVNSEFYYAPYINWATRYGITTGVGDGSFRPDQPINREQMATFLVRFAERFGYAFTPIREDIPDEFADADTISGYAQESVEVMRQCGLLSGRLNAEGTFDFDPLALAARSECAAVFHRLFNSLVPDERFYGPEPTRIDIREWAPRLFLGDELNLDWYCYSDSYYYPITWVSSDPRVATVSSEGIVTAHAEGPVQIYAYTCNGLYDMIEYNVGPYIGYYEEGYDEKSMHVFGEVVWDNRAPYGYDATREDYEATYVYVTVKVWDFSRGIGSEKVTKERTFYIHKNLELTVKKLFEEIYACEEQFPINSIVTYWASSGYSEHCVGTAIDINPDQNPYVDYDGTVLVGKEFDPENNPYSIPVEGKLQQIFEKYGFNRGIYWGGRKDYMHFSFFGT